MNLNPFKWFQKTELVPLNRFDAASRHQSNTRHWGDADNLGPQASLQRDTRSTVKIRSRHVVKNNPVLNDIVATRVNDLIGTGPRLCISIPGATPEQQEVFDEASQKIENEWSKWARASRLTNTLKLMKKMEIVDGEGFAVKITNKKIKHPVKLQLKEFESDLVQDFMSVLRTDPFYQDGIQYDKNWEPEKYYVLKRHPGDGFVPTISNDYDSFDAEQVYHFYRKDRAQQLRGMSWLAPALQTIPMADRFTSATLNAAEIAAKLPMWVETDVQIVANQENEDLYNYDEGATNSLPLPYGDVPILPAGSKFNGLRPEHPSTTFDSFSKTIWGMIGRCLNMPLNVSNASSAGYNFTSGRLDKLPYQSKLESERENDLGHFLFRLVNDWIEEAFLVGIIPSEGLPPVEEWDIDWNYDGFEFISPKDETEAAVARIEGGLSNHAIECAAIGTRWRKVFDQKKIEQDYAKRIGLKLEAPKPAAPPGAKPPNPDNPDDTPPDENTGEDE